MNIESLKRINGKSVSVLCFLELCPGFLVHNNHGIGCFVGKLAECFCNGADCRSGLYDISGNGSCGSALGKCRNKSDKGIGHLLDDSVCDLAIDIANESLATHRHNFV